jgi:tetratricopeptide (TPR) repeat protein
VKYVGDDACAGCHRKLFKSFRLHSMGLSLAPVSAAAARERYDEEAGNFDAAGFRYHVVRDVDRVYHQEVALDSKGRPLEETKVTAEVQFAVGSGKRGRSYLVNRDGRLWLSPITWYPLKAIWHLSPGYEADNPHFGRPVLASCLFCHCNHVEPIEDTVNSYEQPIFGAGHAIGCERCHGPGALHVERRRGGEDVAGLDATIVNPRHLEYSLREAVCQQCHLQGQQRVLRRGRREFDYRPGLPLQLFFVDFVKPAEQRTDDKFVGTVEQMFESRCFQKSDGKEKMGCISCHDPHELPAPEQKVAYYRERCMNCHAGKACSAPLKLQKENNDSCIACHMPRGRSEINHTAITDHRIPRHGKEEERRPLARDWPREGQPALVPFHRAFTDTADDDLSRDLGLALAKLADEQPGAIARRLCGMALPLLDTAVLNDSGDVPAWEAKGIALWFQGRLDDALAAYQAALDRAPRRETTLFLAATLALRSKRTDLARSYCETAIEVNPWRWQYHHTLAAALFQGKDWPGAARALQQGLQFNPANPGMRKLLVACNIKMSQQAQAQTEFDTFLELIPVNQRDAQRRWFAQLK